jgi:uracil-DNA glycosylase
MDERAELLDLIQQAKEHLRYYQELGLTHIGAHEEPQLNKLVAAPKVVATETRNAPPVPKAAPAPEAPPIRPQIETIPAAPPAVSPVITMNENQAPESLSLFDEPSTPPKTAAAETLEDIRRDLGECQRCKLWATRTNIVFGEGHAQAELMFVGEAPGADEDATGRPFVGRAGQLLTKMIEAIGLKREDVYIANILKSRPPGNRNPEADETKACKPFLLRQIAVIKPKLIVTLGNPATQGLLETKVGITKMRGEFQPYPRFPGIYVLPTFHPAYLLRSPDKKREAWEDLKKVRAFLRGEITL